MRGYKHPKDQMRKRIPDEIVEAIFLQLPVKSLIRFKSVSKTWHSNLGSRSFAVAHYNHSRNKKHNNSLIVRWFGSRSASSFLSVINHESLQESATVRRELGHDRLDCRFLPSGSKAIVTCCSDGILSVALDGDSLFLGNPSIGEYLRLPRPTDFDGTTEVFGFGYDDSIDDYKVVRAPSDNRWSRRRRSSTVVDIITLRSNRYWRRIYHYFPYSFCHDQQPMNVKGGLYWFARDPPPTEEEREYIIIRFDIKEETFKEVEIPPDSRNHGQKIMQRLGVLKGNLSFITANEKSRYWDLWVLKEEENWIKLTRISHVEITSCLFFELTPLCYINDSEIAIKLTRNQVLVYNLKCSSYRILRIRGLSVIDKLMTVYSESLVCPPNNIFR